MKIGIIDDEEKRVRAFKTAAASAGLEDQVEFSLLAEWKGPECLETTKEAVATIEDDVLFWLDLKLRKATDASWPWINEFLNTSPGRRAAEVCGDYVDGLAVALALSELATPRRRLLFVVASSHNINGDAVDFLSEQLRSSPCGAHVRAVSVDTYPREGQEWRTALLLQSVVLQDWPCQFPDVPARLANDVVLRELVHLLLELSETSARANGGRTFWSHSELSSAAIPAVARLSAKLGLTRDATNGVKALMECGPREPGWHELFQPDKVFTNSAKLLPRVDLEGVLKALGVADQISLEGDAFALPVQPGLPFLLSLRSFLRIAELEEGAKVEECVWSTSGSSSTITIALSRTRTIDGQPRVASIGELRSKFELGTLGPTGRLCGLREGLYELTFGTVKELRGQGGILALFSWWPGRKEIVKLCWNAGRNAVELKWPV